MAGGPVNGVSWSAMLGAVGGGALSAVIRGENPDPNDPVNYTGIIVPTVLQIAADVVKWFTGLTCMYDRYWTAEPGRVTLPVCMFHVKKITPTYTVEVSKKRVVLYEQQDASAVDKADALRPSVMRAVTDNAVKQPTTYSMEVIVPFQPFGRYFTESAKMVSDLVVAFSDLVGGESNTFTNVWEGIFSSVFALLKTWTTVTNTLAKLPGGDGAAYINMNSLEAMAGSCRTLCMKMWTGYEYKFAMITGFTYDKQPLEDDVFRATLSLQEMPVLAVSPPKPMNSETKGLSVRAKLVAATQGALITPLVQFTGVKKAATSTSKVGMDMINSALQR
jgi:hypothetical protein